MTAFARRQAGFITLGAIALLAGLHFISPGPSLSHLDFIPGGLDALEFCDPRNPRTIDLSRRPPAILVLTPAAPPIAGRTVETVLTLRTATGKPIGSSDLLPTASQKIHLRIVGPSPADAWNRVPEPGRKRGEWEFAFTPREAGNYRVFADFTPVATGREISTSADLLISAEGH